MNLKVISISARRWHPRAGGLLVLLGGLLALPSTARAQDAFEIQVYDYQTAAPGTVGFEMHTNNFLVGRKDVEDGEHPTHHMTHLTIEPHIGIASWCEAGAYIQTAIRGDGSFDFAGLKLRFKARVPRRLAGVVGLSLNMELASIPQEYEAIRFGMELRPIIDFEWKRLYVSINPILSLPFGGPLAGHPELEPAVKVAIRVTDLIAVGPEYYGSYGPLDGFDKLDNQTHRLFGAIDLAWQTKTIQFDLNVAAGYGFTGPDKVIAKMIFAMDFPR